MIGLKDRPIFDPSYYYRSVPTLEWNADSQFAGASQYDPVHLDKRQQAVRAYGWRLLNFALRKLARQSIRKCPVTDSIVYLGNPFESVRSGAREHQTEERRQHGSDYGMTRYTGGNPSNSIQPIPHWIVKKTPARCDSSPR